MTTAPLVVPLWITVTLEGETIIDRVLQGIEQRASSPFSDPAVVSAVVAAFRKITAAAFASEGTRTAAWPALALSTQADRRRHGFPAAHPILHRTGALERALTVGDGAHVSTSPTRLAYQLESELDYFKYHQSNRPRRKLPRRAPVLLTADDRMALMHPVRLYLTGRDPSAQRRGAARL
jgi:hypothetical protein